MIAGAQLQGASLDSAELQGASLDAAQLQGASLDGAQLQGASLVRAQLQGALLDFAQLQAASLDGAQLQGASLALAQLQVASLLGAQLQGASFAHAALEATDLATALLWRSNFADFEGGAVAILSNWPAQWLPVWRNNRGEDQFWTDKAYQDLRKMMEALPTGILHDEALERIRRLDCANPDMTLASCDPSLPPPPEAAAQRNALEAAQAHGDAYTKALAKDLKGLICSGDDNAIYVVRGLLTSRTFSYVGFEMPTLVDFIVSKDCLVSASLTDADKAALLRITHGSKKPGG